MVSLHLPPVRTAQLPDPSQSADRVFITDDAVIVLDGASAFAPSSLSAATYADRLGRDFAERMTRRPQLALTTILAQAIASTAATLGLAPGPACPSSTVAVARFVGDRAELLVLGDSLVVHPALRLIDDRLARIATTQRDAYRARLAAGGGYDQTHRELLADLQEEQRRYRNQPDGYWIAEADPVAAEHALTATVPTRPGHWIVLATDGAYRPVEHLGLIHWSELAQMPPAEMNAVLERAHSWESETDPNGANIPRAKRHDDKTLAAVAWPSLRSLH